jgi:hypothetical protein
MALVVVDRSAPDWAQRLAAEIDKQLDHLRQNQLRQYTLATLPKPARPRQAIWLHGSSHGSVPAYSDEAGNWRFFSNDAVVS